MAPEKLNTHMMIRLDRRHAIIVGDLLSAGASKKYSDATKFERHMLRAEVSPKGPAPAEGGLTFMVADGEENVL